MIAPRLLAMVSLTLAILALPLVVEAQLAPAARIGRLAPESRPYAIDPCRQALKELGWVEGGNLAIEQRYARGVAGGYPEIAADLVRLSSPRRVAPARSRR